MVTKRMVNKKEIFGRPAVRKQKTDGASASASDLETTTTEKN